LPPHESIEIGQDGTVSLRELGQAADVLAAVDRIKLVSLEQGDMIKGADGLLRSRDGINAEPDGAVQLVSGYLEGSNVNMVDSMVEMINLTRNYEMNVKLIQTHKQNSETSARLLQIQ
jgi:flagellar basal-body rod protein FlgF